ncbi:DUF2633 family protein [Escherichia coli]|nr:DUF2633 family protein [Escherichia coli]
MFCFFGRLCHSSVGAWQHHQSKKLNNPLR